MKITHRQLKRIISEEIQRCISEAEFPTGSEPEINLDISKVFNVDIAGIDMSDYPDFVDAFVESAEYEYTPGQYRELTQDELDHLNNEESSWLYQQVWEQVN